MSYSVRPAYEFASLHPDTDPSRLQHPQPAELKPLITEPADRLPESARAKLAIFRDEKDAFHGATMASYKKQQDLFSQRMRFEGRLRELTTPAPAGRGLSENDPLVFAENEKIRRVDEELARLENSYAAKRGEADALGRLILAIEDFARKAGPDAEFALIEIEEPKLQKGENHFTAVERCRRRVRELNADLHRVNSAPYPSAIAKQRARAEIEALAERGRPDVLPLIEIGDAIEWKTTSASASVKTLKDVGIASVSQLDALGLTAWLHKDALIAAINREIDALADDANALTEEQRAAKRAEIAADMLAIEREEEALIMFSPTPITRRADADPRAVLGIEIAN